MRAGRADGEERAAGGAHVTGPAQGGRSLAFARAVAGVTRIHGKAGQEICAATQRAQGAMMRDEQGQQRNEIVRFRNCETEFFQKSFEVLFSGLLTVEAYEVPRRREIPR